MERKTLMCPILVHSWHITVYIIMYFTGPVYWTLDPSQIYVKYFHIPVIQTHKTSKYTPESCPLRVFRIVYCVLCIQVQIGIHTSRASLVYLGAVTHLVYCSRQGPDPGIFGASRCRSYHFEGDASACLCLARCRVQVTRRSRWAHTYAFPLCVARRWTSLVLMIFAAQRNIGGGDVGPQRHATARASRGHHAQAHQRRVPYS